MTCATSYLTVRSSRHHHPKGAKHSPVKINYVYTATYASAYTRFASIPIDTVRHALYINILRSGVNAVAIRQGNSLGGKSADVVTCKPQCCGEAISGKFSPRTFGHISEVQLVMLFVPPSTLEDNQLRNLHDLNSQQPFNISNGLLEFSMFTQCNLGKFHCDITDIWVWIGL